MEKQRKKWYYSYPMLILTFFLFYPASLVLTILRFKDRIDQEKGYKIRSKIAFIWNMAWLVLYSMAFLEWFVDSKWEREYQKYLNEKNYSSAKEVLNSKADKDVTKDVAEKYIELWEVSEDYSGAEEVIERYSEKLSDIADFDGALEKKITEIMDEFSAEQQEKIQLILNNVDEKKKVNESLAQESAEAESRNLEESIVAASKEREAEIVAESKKQEELIAAESKKQEELTARESQEKLEKVREADIAKQEEFRNRMQEFVNEWSDESNKKLIKKLKKEDETQVKEFLLDKMKTEMRENDVLRLKNMQLYCEMYQTLYGVEDIREIINQVNQVKTLDEKLKQVQSIKIGKNSFDISKLYDSCATGEWYISQRLETKYDDTISGDIRKEVDSYRQVEGSEWVGVNVTYTMYGQDIGDEKVVFYSSQKNPFSKSGSYFLRYVESSETKTLINDNGFERTVPVYYLLDDTIDLNERYENWYRIKEEKQQEEDKLKRLVALK